MKLPPLPFMFAAIILAIVAVLLRALLAGSLVYPDAHLTSDLAGP